MNEEDPRITYKILNYLIRFKFKLKLSTPIDRYLLWPYFPHVKGSVYKPSQSLKVLYSTVHTNALG